MNLDPDFVKTLLIALLGAGLLGYVKTGWHAFRGRMQNSTQIAQRMHTISEADQSLVVIAKARDQLAEDLDRSRRERAEDRVAFLQEKESWMAERAQLKDEVDRLEQRLRDVLEDIIQLRTRNNLT